MLELDEVRRLLNACAPEVRPIVEAGLMTGARYGEITRFCVGDFDADQKALRIRQTKTGKTLYQPLTPEGVEFFEGHVAGRSLKELIFTRDNGEPWAKSHQSRPVKEAAQKACLDKVSFKVTRATYGKLLLLATQDIELVAKALGHTDSRVTRKHYAQYLPNEIAQAVQKLPTVGVEIFNVRSLKVATYI